MLPALLYYISMQSLSRLMRLILMVYEGIISSKNVVSSDLFFSHQIQIPMTLQFLISHLIMDGFFEHQIWKTKFHCKTGQVDKVLANGPVDRG